MGVGTAVILGVPLDFFFLAQPGFEDTRESSLWSIFFFVVGFLSLNSRVPQLQWEKGPQRNLIRPTLFWDAPATRARAQAAGRAVVGKKDASLIHANLALSLQHKFSIRGWAPFGGSPGPPSGTLFFFQGARKNGVDKGGVECGWGCVFCVGFSVDVVRKKVVPVEPCSRLWAGPASAGKVAALKGIGSYIINE